MASQKRKVYVIGVGMTKFEKPGRREDFDYPDMAKESVTKALADAGLPYTAIQQAAVGYCYGDSGCGQRALYPIGLTGIPVYNVNNACATGSTALVLGKQLIEGGTADCVLALGFEKMDRGSLSSKWTDRVNPVMDHVSVLSDRYGITGAPITPQMFGSAGREHMEKYGTTPDHFAKIAEKNHRHSANNPNSQFRDVYTLEQIKSSKMVYEPLTKLQCCPTSDGSAAAVLASEDFVKKHNLQKKAVLILAMEMATDLPSTFKEGSCMKMVGYDMTNKAAKAVFAKSGYKPSDVQVIELHDCFSANELITYEALGLCPPGKAGELIDRGDNTYGGKYVINPSGGLISKGHPLGATGLAQCAELCWQLRGEADKRQVPGARIALQHNLGLGGACVVSLYKLGFPEQQATGALARMGGLRCEPLFGLIEGEIKNNGATLVKKVKGVYLFKIKGDDGSIKEWKVDLKNGSGSVTCGPGQKGDCTISMKDSDFMDMASGKLSGQKAFFEGKLKIAGNTALAMKLQSIMPKAPPSKL